VHTPGLWAAPLEVTAVRRWDGFRQSPDRFMEVAVADLEASLPANNRLMVGTEAKTQCAACPRGGGPTSVKSDPSTHQ